MGSNKKLKSFRFSLNADSMDFMFGYARHLGIPVVRTSPFGLFGEEKHVWERDGSYWSGKVLYIRHLSMLPHEIAHFLLASKDERLLPNWGLVVDDEDSERREEVVDILEKAITDAAEYSSSRNIETVEWR